MIERMLVEQQPNEPQHSVRNNLILIELINRGGQRKSWHKHSTVFKTYYSVAILKISYCSGPYIAGGGGGGAVAPARKTKCFLF